MTAIIILNVVFSVGIVAAILGVLAWGIVRDRTEVATLSAVRHRRERVSPFARHRDQVRVRASRRPIGRALDVGA